jgi:hypothetical protein
MNLFWFCSVCGAREPAQEDYRHGDSEECSDCEGRAVVLTLPEIEAMTWRCFHCGEVFVKHCDAIEHFGIPGTVVTTACQVDAKRLRELEAELARYRNEDSDLDRKYYAMEADHATALRRAEEAGYAKGLQDGKTYWASTG